MLNTMWDKADLSMSNFGSLNLKLNVVYLYVIVVTKCGCLKYTSQILIRVGV
jgi:hypothetical protein